MPILPARVIILLSFHQEGIPIRNEREREREIGQISLSPNREDKTITISKIVGSNYIKT